MQDWRSWSRWFEPGLRHSWFLNIFDVKSFCLFLKIRMLILQLICLYAHIIQFEMSNGDHQRAGEPSSQSYSPAHMKWEWIKLSLIDWVWVWWLILILSFDMILMIEFFYFILNLKFNFDIEFYCFWVEVYDLSWWFILSLNWLIGLLFDMSWLNLICLDLVCFDCLFIECWLFHRFCLFFVCFLFLFDYSVLFLFFVIFFIDCESIWFLVFEMICNSYCWLSLQFWFWKKLFFCFWFWFLFSFLSFEVRKWF